MSRPAILHPSFVLAAIGTVLSLAPACADPVADFYKDKTITIIISTGVGGTFDITARTLARHMPNHIPGHPSMIVKSMPGGGHVLATNYMYNQAAKDGTFIATVNNSVPLHQAIGGKGVRFDARKFNWLGSTGASNLLTVAWHTAGFRTMDDVMKRELVTGATGVGSGTFIYPNTMNVVLGTKFKIVMGYKSVPQINLAIERGEIAARSGASYVGLKHERPQWFTEKKIAVLTQVGKVRDKELPNVPLMFELAKTPEQREILTLISSPPAIGRPFFTPPGIPADRLAALKKAFAATMKDPAFLADAKQQNIELDPFGGDRVAEIVASIVNAPTALRKKAKAILAKPKKK
jgi:tripartite-type tricarboxylate transporter receptor subunit TctC